jgi:hypothetical protein
MHGSVSAALAWSLLCFSVGGTTASAEDELPADLLLQCEGKREVTLLFFKPSDWSKQSNERDNTTIRLKDGSMVDVDRGIVLGKSCNLINGKVRCELNEIRRNPELRTTSKKEYRVFLERETGLVRVFLEDSTFNGQKVIGDPSYSRLEIRTGVCRPVTRNRIF